jgi:hypothetical protein
MIMIIMMIVVITITTTSSPPFPWHGCYCHHHPIILPVPTHQAVTSSSAAAESAVLPTVVTSRFVSVMMRAVQSRQTRASHISRCSPDPAVAQTGLRQGGGSLRPVPWAGGSSGSSAAIPCTSLSTQCCIPIEGRGRR